MHSRRRFFGGRAVISAAAAVPGSIIAAADSDPDLRQFDWWTRRHFEVPAVEQAIRKVARQPGKETLPRVNRINMRGAGMSVYNHGFEYNLDVFSAPLLGSNAVKVAQGL